MRTLKIDIPDSLDMKDYDFLMILSAKLYEDSRLSLGQAAKMARVSKNTFIELLGKYGVSVFSDSISDLHSDISNA
jgi:predicted HTH domain antitoxin